MNIRSTTIALMSAALLAASPSAGAATTYSFTQGAGSGNLLYGAFTSIGSGLEYPKRPFTFDFTVAAPLAANSGYYLSLPGLTYPTGLRAATAALVDLNFSDGTPISTFSLAQYERNYPGTSSGYYGYAIVGTDGAGGLSFYHIRISAISAYVGPLTGGFTTPTNIQFFADSTTALDAASAFFSVMNTSRFGTPDFGGLSCSSVAQNCGGGFTVTQTGGGVAGVPEPATWALLLTGFGLLGAAVRRRRPAAVAA